MIFDTISNCNLYYGINDKFEKAFEFIKKAVADNLPEGKYEIEGEKFFASVQEYTTKAPCEAKGETHRKYIDIQFIERGTENVEMMNISVAEPINEYNCEKDVQFFKDNENAKICPISAGEYGIFMPYDIHKPGMCINGKPADVKKVVVKVKVM